MPPRIEQSSGTAPARAAGVEYARAAGVEYARAAGVEYAPAHVVRTIVTDFYRHRRFVAAPRSLTGDPATTFSADAPSISDRVVTEFAAMDGYVRLDAEHLDPRGPRRWVVFLVLQAEREYARNSPRLANLLQLVVETDPAARAGLLDELFIVAPQTFFERANLVEAVRSVQARYRLESGVPASDPAGTAPFITLCGYVNFALCVPEHILSPACRVMAEPELEEMLRREMLQRVDLPQIHHVDPMVLWAGARVGQVLEISRTSNTAGWSVYWRRIVHSDRLPVLG